MNADGSGVRKLTSEPSDDLEPTWSRDGRKIAFTSDRAGGKRNVWTIDVDPDGTGLGKNPTQVAAGTLGIDGPAFSPAVEPARLRQGARHRAGLRHLRHRPRRRAPPAERCLTFKTAPDQDPAWSPDGTEILFTRDTGGERDLFLLRADTVESERPVTVPGDGSRFQQPAWSPGGRRAAAGRHRARARPRRRAARARAGAAPSRRTPVPIPAPPATRARSSASTSPTARGSRASAASGMVVTARCVGVERGHGEAGGRRQARPQARPEAADARQRARALRRRPQGGRAAQARREGPQAARDRAGPAGRSRAPTG